MKNAPAMKHEAQLKASSEKIGNLSMKLHGAEKTMTKQVPIQDWAARYDMWSSWEDVEELNASLLSEKSKLDTLKEGSSFMGHYHDHAEGLC